MFSSNNFLIIANGSRIVDTMLNENSPYSSDLGDCALQTAVENTRQHESCGSLPDLALAWVTCLHTHLQHTSYTAELKTFAHITKATIYVTYTMCTHIA